MSTSKLERKLERVISRARCDQCKSTLQRCQGCLEARLAASAKLSCVGSGYCECTADTKVSARTARVEHRYDMWRLRSCQNQSEQQSSSKARQQPHAAKDNSHVAQRDLNATLAFPAILAVDVACGGRSRSFCRSQCPLSSRAGSKDTTQSSPED